MSAEFWVSIGVTAAGFLGILWRTSVLCGEIKSQTVQGLKGVRSLMESTNLLLGALTKQNILSAEQVQTVLNPFHELAKGSLDELISRLRPTGNPITPEELTILRDQMLEIRKFVEAGTLKTVPMDAADKLFKAARAIRDDAPDDHLRQELVELAAFVLGVASVDKNASRVHWGA
jgi:hypothetical protein